MAILAFGVPRFGANQQGQPVQKTPVATIQELNQRKEAMGIADEDVISVQLDDEFYHVFYRKAD